MRQTIQTTSISRKILISYKVFRLIKFLKILIFLPILLIFASCEETKRFEISGNDKTPPDVPTFLKFERLAGGSRVYFLPPDDEDLLYVEASYVSEATGKTLRFSASYFAESIDIFGFGKAGNFQIELCAVDRAGNRSETVDVTVASLEPTVATVAKTVQIIPSFAAILTKWDNETREPFYFWVDFSYIQNGEQYNHTTVFTTSAALSETRTITMLGINEPVAVQVRVMDKYDNLVHAKDTLIKMLTDYELSKEGWSMLPKGVVMDGISQVTGLYIETVIDGLIDISVANNYFVTTLQNPWNLIIDLGEKYELSRIITHQRWTGYGSFGQTSDQGNLYRGDNVLSYNLYGWNETALMWELISKRTIDPPVVLATSEYIMLGFIGDGDFLYPLEPKFSKPTRWFRLEASNGKYISEITLWGRKAN